MSIGPGSVQRGIIAAFAAEPSRRFSVRELAASVYLAQEVTPAQTSAIRRAIGAVPGLHTCRIGTLRKRGWRHVYGLADS